MDEIDITYEKSLLEMATTLAQLV